MGASDRTSHWDEEWNISFAGCGFRCIYYLGALSCILQQVPQLVQGASKICGASSGCLVAAALTVGIPIEQLCADILSMAKEGRSHTLGVFHPTFSLLRSVRDSLLERLPADAHLRASGRLCVSLTSLADGKNVLVSEFDSREELIQVLMCSCFFPVYCGFTPPSYRGVRYMDGALSNNMPLFEQRNTITMAPFSGETDISPREGTFNFFEVHYGNVSIQVNTGNVQRICTSFLPPRPEKLAEICHSGYMDAQRFLTERDLLATQRVLPSLAAETDSAEARCEPMESKERLLNGPKPRQEDQQQLDMKLIENLPARFKKVLCEACSVSHHGGRTLSVRAGLHLLTLVMLPMELSIALVRSILSGSAALCRLFTTTPDLCEVAWSSSAFPEQSCSGSKSDLRSQTGGNKKIKPSPSNSSETLHWEQRRNLHLSSLRSTGRPTTPACGKAALNQRSESTQHS